MEAHSGTAASNINAPDPVGLAIFEQFYFWVLVPLSSPPPWMLSWCIGHAIEQQSWLTCTINSFVYACKVVITARLTRLSFDSSGWTHSKDSFKVGTKVIVAQDSDLRGDIEIGSGSILHPRCTILAMLGPIILGSNCIVEENAVIVNRSKQIMTIGDNNVFHVGCRVESPSIGSYNTFGAKCRVVANVAIGSHVNVGAGCVVLPKPVMKPSNLGNSSNVRSEKARDDSPSLSPPSPPPKDASVPKIPEKPTANDNGNIKETLSDFTVIFGGDSRRRKWTGEGIGQVTAFHEKHLLYLRETIPKYNKLKMF